MILLCFLAGCGHTSSTRKTPVAVKGVLDLRQWDFEKQGPVELSGDWEMYWERLLTGAEPGIGTSIQPSGFYRIPGSWVGKKLPNGTGIGSFGYATFHLKILMPQKAPLLTLSLPWADTAYGIYQYKQVLFQSGDPGRTKQTSRPLYLPGAGPFTLKHETEIYLQVSNFHTYEGGPRKSPLLGAREQVARSLRTKRQIDFFLIGISFVFGMYHLSLFLLRRTEKAPLWLGLFCFLIALRAMQVGQYLDEVFPETDHWATLYTIQYVTLYLTLPVFAAYFKALFPETVSLRIIRGVQVAPLFLVFLVLALPTHTFAWTLNWFWGIAIVSVPWIAYEITKTALIRRDSLAAIALLGLLIGAGAMVNDILNYVDLIDTGDFLHYGLFVFIFCQAAVIAISNSRARKTAEYLSGNLAVEVEEKTRDLALRNQETESITEIAVAVQQSPGVDDITNTLSRYLYEHFGLSAVLFYLVDDRGHFQLLSSGGSSTPELMIRTDPRPVIFDLGQETLKNNAACLFEYEEHLKAYQLSGSSKSFPLRAANSDAPPRAVISIPLQVSGKIMGLMICASTERIGPGSKRFSVESPARLARLLSAPIYHRELFEQEVEERIRLQNENAALQTEIQATRMGLETIDKEYGVAQQDLEEANEKLLQAEKMSSLGRMMAGVAQEINSPMTGISGAAHSVIRELREFESILKSLTENNPEADEFARACASRFERMDQHLGDIKTGTDKVTEINQALRNYSRLDPEPQSGVNILDVLEESLVILTSRVKPFHIEKRTGELPVVTCHPSHMGQAFTNLIANGADALNEKLTEKQKTGDDFRGKILITSGEKKMDGIPGIFISIEDNGKGVPVEIRDRIMEAFFTTKPPNIGTGLGLAITDKIIKDHGGRLDVKNATELNGACFEIWLPLQMKLRKESESEGSV